MSSVVAQTPFNKYVANGIATLFPYEFQLPEAADLVVTLDGVETLDYVLAGVGLQDGGSVTFPLAPTNGVTVLIHRVIELERDTDYQFNGDLLEDTLDRDINRVWWALQDMSEVLGRTLQLPLGSTAGFSIDPPGNGMPLRYKADGTGVEPYTPLDIAGNPTLQAALASSAGASMIGFMPSGSGAVQRSTQSKLREFVTPQDFGAVGDGVANDTAALQAMLNASLNVSLGGPAFNYKISGPLFGRSGHIVMGAGATITQTLAQVSPGDAVEVFNVVTKTDIAIAFVNFVGVGSDYLDSDSSRACGIYGATSGARISAIRCKFTGFTYAAARFVGAQSCSFNDNVVVGPGSPELTPITNGKCYGVLFDAGCTGSVAGGNSISKMAQGIRVEDCDDTRIFNNQIFDIVGQHGIYAGSQLRNLSIVGNTIYDVDLIGIKVQAADAFDNFGIVITGNTVHTTGDQGILLTNGNAGAGRCKNFTISGNTVYNTGSSGINVQYAKNGVVTGNHVDSPVQYGVNLKTCDDILVAANGITGSGLSGILDESVCTRVTIRGNTLTDCAASATVSDRYGIKVQTCTGWVIDGNVIRDANAKMDYGIFITGGTQSALSVTNNVVTDSVIAGFRGKTPAETMRAYFGNFWGGPLPTANDPIVPTVASATALTLPQSGNVFHISGTTAITSILVNGHTGKTVTLIFDSTASLTDGGNLILAGSFSGATNKVVVLVCDGLNWYQAAPGSTN